MLAPNRQQGFRCLKPGNAFGRCNNMFIFAKHSELNMKLWKWSGVFLVATGLLHTAFALFAGKNLYVDIIQDGIVGAIGSDYSRHFAFWFLICGIFLVVFGQVLHFYIKKVQQPAPAFFGYALLALAIAGCLVVPASGFWLFIPQALIIICANRKKGNK